MWVAEEFWADFKLFAYLLAWSVYAAGKDWLNGNHQEYDKFTAYVDSLPDYKM